MKKTSDIRFNIVTWSNERDRLLAVRLRVFVEEQHVPLELEEDGKDQNALHILVQDRDDNPLATARMLPDGQIGRMAVLPEWRNRGIGRQMLNMLLDQARQQQVKQVFLHAQCSAIAFYRSAGFQAEGEVFDDAGIPHRTMRKRL